MQRRPFFNYGLQRAVEWARHLNRPLVILEALRCDYRWASQRIHRFIMDGMADHLGYFASKSVSYFPYVEAAVGEGKGLLQALGRRACVVVTDEFPCYFLPHMLKAASAQVPVLLEAVDGNGLLPLRAAPKAFERAVDFRRFLQKNLAAHLEHLPLRDPLSGARLVEGSIPAEILQRWPRYNQLRVSLSGLPISSAVTPVDYRGGFVAAESVQEHFLHHQLPRYLERSQPSSNVASGLSPYLHFGHASVFSLFEQLAGQESWNLSRMKIKADGSKEGTWGMSEGAESFLDQIVTWRELGYVFAHYRSDYDSYQSLPGWALKTLEEHEADRREHRYSLSQLEQAGSHDEIWNAAQRQLCEEGRIHNYLRMLWGKKILEWSAHPREALDILIELNNKYALDGRNPNSYSGIFWCLGRFDRPWFERPIFGTVRYMSSDSTRRKFKLDGYLRKWGAQGQLGL